MRYGNIPNMEALFITIFVSKTAKNACWNNDFVLLLQLSSATIYILLLP